MYKYIFGPVPSRRLGMSLGIDVIPKKVCSLDCIYCEVGKTTRLTVERKEYIPFGKIRDEIYAFFRTENSKIDYITFSGSGEPTLNSRIGDIIGLVKEQKPRIPVAVLTNGTLLHIPEVRRELSKADLVLPSLDAVLPESFRRINRPEKSITVDKYINGLADFRNEFKGKIYLEVFILPGFNDTEEDIIQLKNSLKKIRPDRIQLNTLDRPGVVEGLEPLSREKLREITELLDLPGTEIITPAPKRKNITSYRKDAENIILETISRRPCTVEDLSGILGLHINEINKYLDVLDAEDKIKTTREERGIFYQKNDL